MPDHFARPLPSVCPCFPPVLSLTLVATVLFQACIAPAAPADAPEVKSLTIFWSSAPTETRAGRPVVFTAVARDQDGVDRAATIAYSLDAADAAYASMSLRNDGVVDTKWPLNVPSVTVRVTATATDVSVPVTKATASLLIRTRVDSISVSPKTTSLTVGQTLQLTPTAAIASGTPSTAPTYTWAVTQGAAAISVSASGLVTAIAPTAAGTPAQVTASAEAVTSSPIAITVVAPAPVATTMAVTTTSTGTVTVGGTRQYAIQVRDQNNAVMTQFTTATWLSVTPAVATVSTSGLATCVTPGTTTIRATGPNGPGGTPLTAEASLQCVAAPSVPTTMAISPSSASAAVTRTSQFTIAVRDQYNAVMPQYTTATWSTGTSTVATISSSGLASCIATGTTAIRAVVGTLNALASLTCTPISNNPFEFIVLTPSTITVAVLGTRTVTASFLDAAGQTTSNGCPLGFAIDASAVAAVTFSDLVATVRGVGAGTTTLRAFCTTVNKSATAPVQVTP